MPICYEDYKKSNGEEFLSKNISHVYRNYYGPNKPYNEYDAFSMNVSKENVLFFLEYTKSNLLNNILDTNVFTLNYSKIDNSVEISESGNFLYKEICFVEDFLKHIGISYIQSLNLIKEH